MEDAERNFIVGEILCSRWLTLVGCCILYDFIFVFHNVPVYFILMVVLVLFACFNVSCAVES